MDNFCRDLAINGKLVIMWDCDYRLTGSLVAEIPFARKRAGPIDRAGKVAILSCNRFGRAGNRAGFLKSQLPNYCTAHCAGMRARPRNEFSSCNRKQTSISGTRASPPDRASPPYIIRPLVNNIFFMLIFQYFVVPAIKMDHCFCHVYLTVFSGIKAAVSLIFFHKLLLLLRTSKTSPFIEDFTKFCFYWGLRKVLLLLRTSKISAFIEDFTKFCFYWGLRKVLLLLRTSQSSAFIEDFENFCFYWGLHKVLLLLRTSQSSAFIEDFANFCFYWGLHKVLLLLRTSQSSAFIEDFTKFCFYWGRRKVLLLLRTSKISAFIEDFENFCFYWGQLLFTVLSVMISGFLIWHQFCN